MLRLGWSLASLQAHLRKQKGLPASEESATKRLVGGWDFDYFFNITFLWFLKHILDCILLDFFKSHTDNLKWKDVNLLFHSHLLPTQPVQSQLCLSFLVTLGFQITWNKKSQLLSSWRSDYCRKKVEISQAYQCGQGPHLKDI